MCYSIEPRERRYVKGYGFMSFARNFRDKYSKSLMDLSKTFAKTAGKKILKETAKATGDLIGTKIEFKIKLIKLWQNCIMKMKLIRKYQKKDIFLLKKDKKLLMN